MLPPICRNRLGPDSRFSQLWGRHGELWHPDGRLPDFSYAGYGQGLKPPPTPPVTANVRAFGARGDGRSDDGEAFAQALAAAPAGAILVPAGRYRLGRRLRLERPGLVLRGEGPDSVLDFPFSLSDLDPKPASTREGIPASQYSWSGGFIEMRGGDTGSVLGALRPGPRRGEQGVELAAPVPGLAPGDRLRLEQTDPPDHSLIAWLYQGDPGNLAGLDPVNRVYLLTRVLAVDGPRLHLERALPWDLRAEWQPRLSRHCPGVTDCGVEDLTIEFPVTPYGGHFREAGYNALAFEGVSDCWARRLCLRHVDSGVFLAGNNCVCSELRFESARPPCEGRQGHHGFYLRENDNLLSECELQLSFIHDVSVVHCAGNVVCRLAGVDLCLDHHKRYPYANLFTALHCGRGSNFLRSGGGVNLGRHAAAWNTYWGITADAPLAGPAPGFGPELLTLVGVDGAGPAGQVADGRWCEDIPAARLWPTDLYDAQLARRLAAAPAPRIVQ